MTTINTVINNIQSTSTTLSPEELVGMFFRLVDPPEKKQLSYAALPYVKGVTESLTRTLWKYNITVTTKPL